MLLGTEKLIIFSLGYFAKSDEVIDKDTFCSILHIQKNTFSIKSSKLMKEGLIKARGKVLGFSLTKMGIEAYKKVYSTVMDLPIQPELHSTPVLCKMGDIIGYYRTPGNILKIIFSSVKKDPLNVISVYHVDSPGNTKSLDELFMEIETIKGGIPSSLEDVARELNLIETSQETLGIHDRDWAKETVKRAGIACRKGDWMTAKYLYGSVLERRVDVYPGVWVHSAVGSIKCTKTLEDPMRAIEISDQFIDLLKNPAHIAMIKWCKAEILSEMKEYNESVKMFDSCKRSFTTLRLPILLCGVLNSMGANYFRMGKMDLAEKQWKRARLLAIKHDLLRLKAFANMNLADCYGLNQRFKTAWNHLNEAKKIMESLGDSEGLSGVDFNMALVSIEEGDKKDALYYSTNCLSFPLLYETKRRERLDVLYDRFKKMGWFFPFHI